MRIPKEFTLYGNKIKVREVEKTDHNQYGYWDDLKNEIVLAHKVKDVDEFVELNQDQIESTFWHEVFHAMQWYSGKETDEREAQTYSFMLMELIKSGGIKINPNVIQESSNNLQ